MLFGSFVTFPSILKELLHLYWLYVRESSVQAIFIW